jgi:hypothetical protein
MAAFASFISKADVPLPPTFLPFGAGTVDPAGIA